MPTPIPLDWLSFKNEVSAALTAAHFVAPEAVASSIDPEVSIITYRSSGNCSAIADCVAQVASAPPAGGAPSGVIRSANADLSVADDASRPVPGAPASPAVRPVLTLAQPPPSR